MKRFIIYLVVVVGMATAVTLKASQKRDAMSELALINIEALSSNEYDKYICAGNIPACYDDYYNIILDGIKQY